ncbi:hypothetical protein OQA88_8469 [Cercophora sp. LCS_1]
MAQPSLSSNNPFRRNGSGAPARPSLASDSPADLPSSDLFRSQLQALAEPAQPPPSTSFQKPKVVKKVRVQSPPPSSPESSGVPEGYSRAGEYDESSDDEPNPFSITQPAVDEARGAPEDHARQQVPPNPFQRTLQDLELNTEAEQTGTPTARAALDVDAFKRLLLTGQTGGSSAAKPLQPQAPAPSGQQSQGDGASLADTSSASRQSIFDSAHVPTQETPRTSHEISEPELDDDRHGLISNAHSRAQTPTTLRKKPPPPSSRHGKLIKPDKDRLDSSSLSPRSSLASPTALEPSTPLEVNKPLPPPPQRHSRGEETESIFDREAAGKVPEPVEGAGTESLPAPRPPTPPNTSHATTPAFGVQSPKKPPPPPRRQPHGRSDSRVSIAAAAPTPTSSLDEHDVSVRRSSQDSTRSRSSSLRVSIHAPAPPPPRRPNHGPRTSVAYSSTSPSVNLSGPVSPSGERSPSEQGVSPGVGSISTTLAETPELVATPSPGLHTHPKLFPPPPPPARNASIRSKRPPSVSSLDATSRRVGASAVPPPPPPRQRGSSKGSIDGTTAGGKDTSDTTAPGRGAVDGAGGRVLEGTFAEEPANALEDGTANDILADLTALQREVDALRGKVEQDPS